MRPHLSMCGRHSFFSRNLSSVWNECTTDEDDNNSTTPSLSSFSWKKKPHTKKNDCLTGKKCGRFNAFTSAEPIAFESGKMTLGGKGWGREEWVSPSLPITAFNLKGGLQSDWNFNQDEKVAVGSRFAAIFREFLLGISQYSTASMWVALIHSPSLSSAIWLQPTNLSITFPILSSCELKVSQTRSDSSQIKASDRLWDAESLLDADTSTVSRRSRRSRRVSSETTERNYIETGEKEKGRRKKNILDGEASRRWVATGASRGR